MIEEVNDEVDVEKAFLNDLQRSIEFDEKKNRREPSKTYKPSSMNCMRKSYYTITGATSDECERSYISIGTCNSGSDIHERIQKAVANMKENGMDCEYVDVAEFVKGRSTLNAVEVISKQGMETKLFHHDLNMSFLCDGIIKYKGKYYILELKSESSNKFWNRKNVDESHYMQAKAYCTALKLSEVIFVYICRDNLQMKSFMYKVTPSMKKEVKEYVATCNEYIVKKQVPPKNEDRKKCQYCEYKEQCRKDD